MTTEILDVARRIGASIGVHPARPPLPQQGTERSRVATVAQVEGALELSVIVPVKDGARSIPVLLDSLAAQTLARDRFEVIVVDNASRDGTGDVARERGATVVEEPVANRSRARNRGAREARADRFAFIDDDCVAAPGWLE